jgi:hypothetical protein
MWCAGYQTTNKSAIKLNKQTKQTNLNKQTHISNYKQKLTNKQNQQGVLECKHAPNTNH